MKKRNRVLALTVAAAMSASLLAGCGSSAQQGGAASSEAASTDTAASVSDGGEDNIIRVGVVCSMTGGSAIYGEGAQNAVDMAVEEINAGDSGYKIEIVNGGKVADDAKDAKQAMNAYNKVMADSPEAIVGSFFSSVTLPMAEQASKDGMLLLATGATNADVTLKGDSIFRNCFIDPYQGKMAALFAKDKGFAKVAVIYAKDDDYSNGLKDAFVENCEANGIEVAYVGECMTTDTDYSSQAAQAVHAYPERRYSIVRMDIDRCFCPAQRDIRIVRQNRCHRLIRAVAYINLQIDPFLLEKSQLHRHILRCVKHRMYHFVEHQLPRLCLLPLNTGTEHHCQHAYHRKSCHYLLHRIPPGIITGSVYVPGLQWVPLLQALEDPRSPGHQPPHQQNAADGQENTQTQDINQCADRVVQQRIESRQQQDDRPSSQQSNHNWRALLNWYHLIAPMQIRHLQIERQSHGRHPQDKQAHGDQNQQRLCQIRPQEPQRRRDQRDRRNPCQDPVHLQLRHQYLPGRYRAGLQNPQVFPLQ